MRKNYDEDEEVEFELPEGLNTYRAISSLDVKELWAEIGKHIAAETGIKARTPRGKMLETIVEYFDLDVDEEYEVKVLVNGREYKPRERMIVVTKPRSKFQKFMKKVKIFLVGGR